MNELQISPIPAFQDNYFWLLERSGSAVVVDPGDAAPVVRELEGRGLSLAAILVTHHHFDHIGGLPALRQRFDVPVHGPAGEAGQIAGLTRQLAEGDTIEVLGTGLTVWEVPGHTAGHIAFVGPGFVLCGDTLFSAGCGRLFEGTPAQMHRSLARLASLPEDTRVYCTHEYTLANLAFALAVEPERDELRTEMARVRELRGQHRPSLPSTIGHERRINPFLRTGTAGVSESVRRHTGQALASELEVFAALRRWKDGFRAPP